MEKVGRRGFIEDDDGLRTGYHVIGTSVYKGKTRIGYVENNGEDDIAYKMKNGIPISLGTVYWADD